jgi:urease accessory protein
MATAAAETLAATFRANRAEGRIALKMQADCGVTRRDTVHESGSLRVRFPNSAGSQAEAVILNTAGGIAGGDRHELSFDVGSHAHLIVTTAAAEKVYRALDQAAQATTRLRVGEGASLTWLPQETILFDGARLSRSIEIDLAEGASLLFCEAVVFGRLAHEERVLSGLFHDRWRVRRNGVLAFADAFRIDDEIADKLARKPIGAGAIAFASLLLAPGDATQVAAVRGCEDAFEGEVGVSCWNGIALARFCARDSAALRHDLALAVSALGCPLPRVWLN